MAINISINGFGRIGRLVLRSAINDDTFNVVSSNDLLDINHLAYLLKYDSVHGTFDGSIEVNDDKLEVNGKSVKITSERDPSKIDLLGMNIDVVAECTGIFTSIESASSHIKAGAKIANSASDIFTDAEIIVKVKEPQKVEVEMIRENQIIYTYLHLAAAKELTEGLIKSKSINIAYETVTDDNGRLPLLAPMSAVAGRMSVQAGAHCLEKNQNGRGLLLGGAPGVTGGTVVILGGGVVGENAAVIATGMQAKVHIVDKSEARLKQLGEMFGDKIIPEQSDKVDLNKLVSEADLLVGGVLIPGAEAPKLITKDMIKLMKRGSVIVDVAIDQGGCVETSKPTTHGDPTYIVDDVVHYCVANMPGGVPRTSTLALNNATLPFLVKLANRGYQKALGEDKNFLAGLNVHKGHVTYKAVADVFGHAYVEAGEAIKN